MLHWLRRDLRRLALPLFLWVGAIALFTWLRVWMRFHQDTFYFGNRGLTLGLLAITLGLAEVWLLLTLLLDDPVRGSKAFWKTRPPSGASAFGAKAIAIIFIAIIIPLTAEAVFLHLAAPSGGFLERLASYLLPPLLALSAGSLAPSWRRAMVWLPAMAVVLYFGTASLLILLLLRGTALFLAEPWMISTAAAITAAACAFAGYLRRCAGPLFVTAAILLPVVAAVAIGSSGWALDRRVNAPPQGVAPSNITITWEKNETPLHLGERPLRLTVHSHGEPRLPLPLTVHGVPEGFGLHARVYGVVITPDGRDSFQAGVDDNAHIQELVYQPGLHLGRWYVSISPAQAEAIAGRACTVRGKIALLFSTRSPVRVPLTGMHRLGHSDYRWEASPSRDPDDNHFYYRAEYTGPSEFTPVQTVVKIDSRSAVVRKAGNTDALMFFGLSLNQPLNLWEGIGQQHQTIPLANPDSEAQKELRRQLSAAADSPDGWELHCHVLTPAGRLEVPFELYVPASR